MSRAFTSERDGWAFCKAKMRECMFAEEDGGCMFSTCRQEPDEKPASASEPAGKQKDGGVQK